MKTKKRFIILIPILAVLVYIVFIRTSYSGDFSFTTNGKDYEWKLKKTEQHKTTTRTLYSVVYSDGDNSAKFTFGIWEENGDTWIALDNPTIHINGKTYVPRRPLRNNDYSFDYYDSSMQIIFWNVPFTDGFQLNGDFFLRVDNSKLIK